MAFAGHRRSYDLSSTKSSTAHIENVHPDRHPNINPDQTSSYNDDTSMSNLSSYEVMLSLTDDMGNTPNTSLWIGNLPPRLTNTALEKAFIKFGSVVSVYMQPPKNVCGFINFHDIDSAINAWHTCHEKDIFDTGDIVYVRFQNRKTKRPATHSLTSLPDSSLRRQVPTGPRSEAAHNLPPSGPRSQHTSISPPPLRRHDMYRPHSLFEEDRTSRSLGDRHRENDLYRPSYEKEAEEAQYDRRGSMHNRDGPTISDRLDPRGSPIESHQSTMSRVARSPSPSRKSSHPPRQEETTSSLGMGIKGLAASRKESSGTARELCEKNQSGVAIKGAAAQSRADGSDVMKTPSNQSAKISQQSLPADQKSSFASSNVQGPLLLGQTAEGSVDLVANNRTLADEAFPVCTTRPCNLTAANKNMASGKVCSETFDHVKNGKKLVPDLLSLKDKLGFAHLSYLFDVKEREESVAKKARTISPFSRLGGSRRDKSVDSAITDPTPLLKPPYSSEDVCDKCEVGGGFLKTFKCAMPSCSKKIHSMCGNLISVTNSAKLESRTKLLCDECLQKDLGNLRPSSPTDSVTISSVGHALLNVSNKVDEPITLKTNGNMPHKAMSAVDPFVPTDTSMTIANSNASKPADSAKPSHIASEGAEKAAKAAPKASVSRSNTRNAYQQPAPMSNGQEVTKVSHPLLIDPPTKPRSMRDNPVTSKALVIAQRYKQSVTCPWWSKGNSCVRLEQDCMFAHKMTGIESPNGRSVAKDWTCYDFLTPQGCRYLERDCLYSHSDTGLHAGPDGRASKKHLECYWWHHNHHCKHSDATCTCTHGFTGLVAEEPMPKDTVRRVPPHSSAASVQDADTFQELPARSRKSPSYSPPLPPLNEGQPTLFATQPNTQNLLLKTPISSGVQDGSFKQSPNTIQVTRAGLDPRLRRNMDSKPFTEQPADVQPKNSPMQDTCLGSTNGAGLTNGSGPEPRSHPAQQTRQPTMNPCKNCSKLIFKAEICTDCLKLGQRQANGQTITTELTVEEENMDISSSEVALKPASFAVPAPKVLKRSRTGSSSNLFASKRMRPDMTTIRTASHQSLATNGTITYGTTSTNQPLTIEHLNRINAEKRAKEIVLAPPADEPDSSTIEVVVDNNLSSSPPETANRAPKTGSTNLLKLSDKRFRTFRETKSGPTRSKEAEQRASELQKRSHEELEADHSDFENLESDGDSDSPLATFNSHSNNSLRSSGTTNQSPPKSRPAPVATVPHVALESQPVVIRSFLSPGSTFRCSFCVKGHRKCVHYKEGLLDGRRCYTWQQKQMHPGVNHKSNCPYPKAEREAIRQKALEYEMTLHGVHDTSSMDDEEIQDEVLGEAENFDVEDVYMSSSDEIQKYDEVLPPQPRRNDKGAKFVAQKSASKVPPFHFPTMSSRSPTPQRRQTRHFQPHSKLSIPEDMMLVPKKPPEEDLADVIARMKANGVEFEDSDTDDDEEDYYQIPGPSDTRVDPLLVHKGGTRVEEPSSPRRHITKGQGLKDPPCVRRRQMMRNRHIFGKPHKAIDRQVPQQEVLALVERRDPDDILALPIQTEEKITMQEFLGVTKDREIEPCLGRVPLPRGKFVPGLAFKEKDTDPGLGAWGRERRGIRKEKPIFVVGM